MADYVEPPNFGDIKKNADPVNVLKKRKVTEKTAATRAAHAAEVKKKKQQKRFEGYKSAEKFVKEYRALAKQRVQMKRDTAKAKMESKRGNLDEGQLLFVIRLHGTGAMLPKAKKILNELRLNQLNTGVFVRTSYAVNKLIKSVEPALAYGTPSLKTIQELIFKHGFGKDGKTRVPLSDNSVVERLLGKHNMVCLEDIVKEIHTVGPNFKEAAKFLAPFKLRPEEKVKSAAKHTQVKVRVKKPPPARGDGINKVVKNML